MNLKTVVTCVIGITAPLQLACGTSPPSPRGTHIQFYSGDRLLQETRSHSGLDVAFCRSDAESVCEETIQRLVEGETVIVQDPVYYAYWQEEDRFWQEENHPLGQYRINMGLETTSILVNRLQAIPDANHQRKLHYRRSSPRSNF